MWENLVWFRLRKSGGGSKVKLCSSKTDAQREQSSDQYLPKWPIFTALVLASPLSPSSLSWRLPTLKSCLNWHNFTHIQKISLVVSVNTGLRCKTVAKHDAITKKWMKISTALSESFSWVTIFTPLLLKDECNTLHSSRLFCSILKV